MVKRRFCHKKIKMFFCDKKIQNGILIEKKKKYFFAKKHCKNIFKLI